MKSSNRTILCICLFLFGSLIISDLQSQEPGFFLDEWQPKSAVIPDYELTVKPTDTATVHINVNHGQVVNKVPQYIYGNNAVTWDNGIRSNATAMKDLNNLSPNVLRWPGGNLSNVYFWNASFSQRPDDIPDDINVWYGQNTQDWQMSVDEYYDLLDKTNSEGLICVNYSYARYGTGSDPVAKAAHMAAEWVRYDNGRSKFWEIGNENFGNWQAGYEIDVSKNQDGQPQFISGKLYGQHCRVFIDSMRAAAAEIGVDIKIGVVAYDAEKSYDPISENWNEGMMPEVGDIADFLVVHSYFTPYNEDSPVSTILSSHDVPHEIMSAVVSDMNEAGKPMLPVAMTEWNIFAVGSMQQVSYVNGMLAALTLGEYVKNDYGLATRWDLTNGWSNGNDHGTFSVGGEPGVDPYNPRPVFFYMYYFQKYFGDRMVPATVTGNSDVVAHASIYSSGETGLVLINKSRTSEIVQVNSENGEFGLKYYYHTLTGGDDNGDFSRKVLINGIETDEEGGGPDNYETIKAKASESVGGIKVELPPLSAVYMMLDSVPPITYMTSSVDTNASVVNVKLTEEAILPDNPSGFEIIANGSVSLNINDIIQNPDDGRFIHLYLENEVLNDDELTISYNGTGIVNVDGIELGHFTGKEVSNLLPGDPRSITFIIKNRQSGLAVDSCRVNFNKESYLTDENGEVVFMARDGKYDLYAKKEFLDPADQDVYIESDTLIELGLDSTEYSLTIHVKDNQDGSAIPFADITLGGMNVQSGWDGSTSINIYAGVEGIDIEKLNYYDYSQKYEIVSDTVLEVLMERSHAKVKFMVRNGSQPLANALVVLDVDSLYTSTLGYCTFGSVHVNASFEYYAEREHYFKASGDISVKSDTAIEIQMIKSVANVEFLFFTEEGSVTEGQIIFNSESCNFTEDGSCKFYNIPVDAEYSYDISGGDYHDQSRTLYLENDTIVNIQLTPVSRDESLKDEHFRIYPNPAGSFLTVSSPERIRSIEIIDMNGIIHEFEKIYIPSKEVELELQLESGIYLLKIETDQGSYNSRLVIE